jgi:protein-disulfide isomerase/uncharacterized membrane protein
MSETVSVAGESSAPHSPGGRPGAEAFAPFFCVVGLCVSAYLTAMHFGILTGDLSLGEACGPGGDCNSVVASRYGTLLGLPVSVWGMWFYLVTGVLTTASLLLRREDAAAYLRATVGLTLVALAFDAWLAWAMFARIGRFCPLCAASYAANLLILVVTLPAARAVRGVPGGLRSLLPGVAALMRPAEPAYYREVLKLFLAGVAVGACALVLLLSLGYSRSVRLAQTRELAGLLEFLVRERPVPISTAGLPARGPEDARISIVVFSDFMCEQCKRASRYFDIVAANHRDDLRITYVNVPSDQACNPNAQQTMHPGACVLARAAACARRQGRFWEFHDAVFADPGPVRPENLPRYSDRAGLAAMALEACIAEGDSAVGLASEIALAKSLGVHATPTSFINGRSVVGALKPWMLEAAIGVLARQPAAGPAPAAPE